MHSSVMATVWAMGAGKAPAATTEVITVDSDGEQVESKAECPAGPNSCGDRSFDPVASLHFLDDFN